MAQSIKRKVQYRPSGIATPLSVYGDNVPPQDINYSVIKERMEALGLNRTGAITMVRKEYSPNTRSTKSWYKFFRKGFKWVDLKYVVQLCSVLNIPLEDVYEMEKLP